MQKFMTLMALLSLTTIGWAGTSREATTDRMDHADQIPYEIMASPDNGISEEVLEHARCVAVVPNLLKGGFVFGAENGRGVATCRTAKGWSAPAFFAITGGSWGLQIGILDLRTARPRWRELTSCMRSGRGMLASGSNAFCQTSEKEWETSICLT